jgi:hypothetical protein
VRLREAGHQITGEVWVVPRDGVDVARSVEELGDRIRELDWRVRDIVVSAVETIEDAPEGVLVEEAESRGRSSA